MNSEATTSRGPAIHPGYGDLESMLALKRVDEAGWKRHVIQLCNWFLFDNRMIRGLEYRNGDDWNELKKTSQDTKEEHREVNYNLIENPPHDMFYSYHQALAPKSVDDIIYGEDREDPGFLQDVLTEAWRNWRKPMNMRRRSFERAIWNIPLPERIKKIVCLGMGRLTFPLLVESPRQREHYDWQTGLFHRAIAQHTLAVAAATLIRQSTGNDVSIYAADPAYGKPHKEALQDFPQANFIILDPTYDVHEGFTEIDDSTLLIAIQSYCPVLRIVQEYARPVVMITHEVSEYDRPEDDVLWYEAKDLKAKGDEYGRKPIVALPGPTSHWFTWSVYDMIAEYELENMFPVEKEENVGKGEFDLVFPVDPPEGAWVDIEHRPDQTYWDPDVRMYVRRD
ncbi:hypothetical protein F4778DRAFT_782621 [Xylariomycetidae sp. FL2044]|nr:hypothetical protein F4778DRAFT_782621 [Xylariomycetidae sp. FL2044]